MLIVNLLGIALIFAAWAATQTYAQRRLGGATCPTCREDDRRRRRR